MELLAGVALFIILILLLIATLIAVGIFTLLYKIFEKLLSYDVKAGMIPDQTIPTNDVYTPESTDTTVPLDQFVPKKGVKIIRKQPSDNLPEEDKITPLEK